MITLSAAVLVSACGASIAATADDATITTRVKIALLNDSSLDVVRIDVTTANRVITLAGRVRSMAEEARAIGLARSVKGVSDVKSALQIQP